MRVQGFSHVTINVTDLSRSLDYYLAVLGMELTWRGDRDAYLEWGDAWVCLQERHDLVSHTARAGVDHIAFFMEDEDFASAVSLLRQAGAEIVRGPERRGPGWSVYFLDPDGTQLEIHTSTLHARMTMW